MGILEIVLLGAGAVIFVASFCVPVKKEKLKEETRELAAEEVKSLVAEELDTVRSRLTELSEEEVKEQIEKSERSMERISNEKIMAVNEYSDTVLDEIHKNHEEVVFLYDMLKNKKESLSEYYGKADENLQELQQQVKDSEITIKEKLEEVTKKLEELEKSRIEAEAVVREAAKQEKARSRRRKREAVSSQEQMAEEIVTGGEAIAEKEAAMVKEADMEKIVSVEENAVTEKYAAVEEEAVAEKEAVTEVLREQPKKEQTPDFQPFVIEKVEVTPKKTRAKKTVKAEKETKKPVREPVKEASAAENADVMLMLSDSMEDSEEVNSNERILALHAAGKSNMAIARELGLGIGEVKLVIDLYEGLH